MKSNQCKLVLKIMIIIIEYKKNMLIVNISTARHASFDTLSAKIGPAEINVMHINSVSCTCKLTKSQCEGSHGK